MDLLLWVWVASGQLVCCFGTESHSWSAALGLCGGQLASAPGAHPPEVSGVGAPPGSGVGGQLGFQLWAPSPLIYVRATGLQVRAGAAYPVFTVQGLRGRGARGHKCCGDFSN